MGAAEERGGQRRPQGCPGPRPSAGRLREAARPPAWCSHLLPVRRERPSPAAGSPREFTAPRIFAAEEPGRKATCGVRLLGGGVGAWVVP